MRLKLTLAALLLIAAPAFAATVAKPDSVGLSEQRLHRVHDAIQRHIDAHDISGAVTVVARRGHIVHLEAHGLMDIESNKPMSTGAIFRIWSMSKPVTGVAILMLMEEGKVRLNDPVSRFIPEFKDLKVAVPIEHSSPLQYYDMPAAREITVQDLLTHTSGLGSGPASGAGIRKIMWKEGDPETLAHFIPQLAAFPLDFQPGSRWTYSPLAGFDTLGRIVEIASGQPFDQFLRERIFEPLGMKETFFHPGDQNWSRVVTAYHRDHGTLKPVEHPNWIASKTYFSGGGGLMSTAEDYAQFGMMLAEGGQLNGKQILSPKTVELMRSIFIPDTLAGRSPGKSWGLSVQVVSDPIAAGQRVSKGTFGWDGAYGTHFWVDPVEHLTGIMMIQTDNSDRQLDRDVENAVMQSIVE